MGPALAMRRIIFPSSQLSNCMYLTPLIPKPGSLSRSLSLSTVVGDCSLRAAFRRSKAGVHASLIGSLLGWRVGVSEREHSLLSMFVMPRWTEGGKECVLGWKTGRLSLSKLEHFLALSRTTAVQVDMLLGLVSIVIGAISKKMVL